MNTEQRIFQLEQVYNINAKRPCVVDRAKYLINALDRKCRFDAKHGEGVIAAQCSMHIRELHILLNHAQEAKGRK